MTHKFEQIGADERKAMALAGLKSIEEQLFASQLELDANSWNPDYKAEPLEKKIEMLEASYAALAKKHAPLINHPQRGRKAADPASTTE